MTTKMGLDYHNVCDLYPEIFQFISWSFLNTGNRYGPFGKECDEVHIISAIGKNRIGTVEASVRKLKIPYTAVHEVVFRHPRESPVLKTAKAVELGLSFFFDDRQDVCDAMNATGKIVAFKVPRLDGRSDLQAEIK